MAIKIKSDAVWLDGKLVPFEDSKVHVLTHTLHYGVAVFEAILKSAQAEKTIRLR